MRTITLLLLAACASEPPPPTVAPITDAEASAAAAALFCEAALQAALPCAATAGVAKLGERAVALSVTVTDSMSLPGRSLGLGASAQQLPGEAQLVASVAAAVDGQPLVSLDFTHAASDVDPQVARAKVLDELLQRWMVGYGLAILDAVNGGGAPGLAGVGMEVAPAALAGARVWSAYPMVSGVGLDPKTGGRLGPSVSTMASALGPVVAGLSPGLHSVRVKADLGGSGGPGPCGILPPVGGALGTSVSVVRLAGEILVDGAPSGDICALSEPVAWPLPRGEAAIHWEQFFVVRADAPPEE